MGFKQWKRLEIAFYVDLASFPCQIVGKSIEIAKKHDFRAGTAKQVAQKNCLEALALLCPAVAH